MINPNLQDKVVLITGANNPSGIGAAAARAFAVQGASLFLHTFHQPYESDEVPSVPGEALYNSLQNSPVNIARELRATGARVEDMEADLADARNVPLIFDRAESAFGRVDVLINNAANCLQDTFIPRSRLNADSRAVDGFPVTTISAELHDRHFAVISRATALMMAEFARRKIERNDGWGRIINMSSLAAKTGGITAGTAYSTSKGAVIAFTFSLAAELAAFGVTVNGIAPAYVRTPMVTEQLSEAQRAEVIAKIPVRRFCEPEEVAHVVLFLADEMAGFITGEIIDQNGGLHFD